MTVLAAPGDNGSNDNVYDGQAHCDYPASDPYVIACGGTTLRVNGGEPVSEIVWNSPLSGWATGGGISDAFGLPSWQEGKGVPASINNGSTGRGVPDLTADADPHTGYNVVVDGAWTVEGGTSAVAPLYAGLFALLDQSLGFPLGFITPYLYSLYETGAFVEIAQGTNQISPRPATARAQAGTPAAASAASTGPTSSASWTELPEPGTRQQWPAAVSPPIGAWRRARDPGMSRTRCSTGPSAGSWRPEGANRARPRRPHRRCG